MISYLDDSSRVETLQTGDGKPVRRPAGRHPTNLPPEVEVRIEDNEAYLAKFLLERPERGKGDAVVPTKYRKQRAPLKVQGHDFPSPEVPRAYPYGIYDIGRNAGFVNVGTDHDTGAFAVASIRGWWRSEGRRIYPDAKTILITADGGGSNGWRLRLWKFELQKFADQTGLYISVCHFPPGTSKWNKIEHRLFSFISSNWRGEPLRDYETVVKLIAKTTTAKGLKVTCRLDRRKYLTGREVSNAQMEHLNLERNKFHGEWNYVIKPNAKIS